MITMNYVMILIGALNRCRL